MSSTNEDRHTSMDAALHALEILRSSDKGCPWLSSQSFEQLLPYFFEELHEYKQATLESGQHSSDTRQELADLIFQTLLHVTLFKEKTGVGLEELCDDVLKKLQRRHPHVFDPKHKSFSSPEEAGKAWEQLKKEEARLAQRHLETQESPSDKLERIPASLPSLQRAARIGEKTQGFGFDWQNPDQVFKKVLEEMQELTEAQSLSHKREEIGDLFFSLAQYARHLGLPPEELAHESNRKFLARFKKMIELCQNKGWDWEKISDPQKELLWKEIKSSMRSDS